MRATQLSLLMAICLKAGFALPADSDEPLSVAELDSRLEWIQNELNAAIENEDRILETRKDVGTHRQKVFKESINKEEKRHLDRIIKGIEEGNANIKDEDKFDALMSMLDDDYEAEDLLSNNAANEKENNENAYLQDHEQEYLKRKEKNAMQGIAVKGADSSLEEDEIALQASNEDQEISDQEANEFEEGNNHDEMNIKDSSTQTTYSSM